jgi:hypothetical protein
VAGSAQAELIAGWDFSQYSGDGSLDTDNDFTGEGTLDANWSTVGALPDGGGPEANPYGTMYIDGTNGSSLTDFEFGFPAEFAASAGGLVSNGDRPVVEGASQPFGSCAATAPQLNCLPLKMKAISAVDVVFQATLAPEAAFGNDWVLSFAGTADTVSKNVTIETSTDGIVYDSVGSELLTAVDSEFVVALGAALDGAQSVFVRLGLTGSLTDGSNLDNVALSANVVPEPGTASLLMVGLLGIASLRRRNG